MLSLTLATAPSFAHALGRIDYVFNFFELGVKHILSGPDHVLFVVAVLLAFDSLREVLRLTVTFTVAHSGTLILAGSGVLTLSSGIVEPVIAFSISFVAISTVFFSDSRLGTPGAKMAIVFVFGLFHGLGFAGLLRESEIPDDRFVPSLLSFNAGIELGQLIIVVWTLPVIYLVRQTQWHESIVRGSAAAIGAGGILWGVERILGG